MTAVVYTPLLGQLNKRQYPVTQDQLGSILAGVNVVTASSLVATLANYVLTASLSGAIAAQSTHSLVTPSTGATMHMAFSQAQACYIAAPGSLLQSLTVILPTSPYDSARAVMSFVHSVNTIGIGSSDGSTVVGAPSSIAVAVYPAFVMIYNITDNSWYPGV